ncbi:MAG: hypothetical protein L6R43_12245 [Planctomycetes bacterium]|nr:hypothetical protein [Planctomycetota bacterium]
MSRHAPRRPWLPSSLLLLALAAGCASTPAPEPPSRASITEEVLAEATVTSVDRATREVALQRADGARFVLVAPPEARNFDRVEPGMKVKARLSITLSVRRLAPGEADIPPTVSAGAARTRLGAKPGGGVAAGLALTVKVVTVDAAKHVVSFTDPDGTLRVVKAEREEGRKFVAGLKAGDRVEIIYTEGVLLGVE